MIGQTLVRSWLLGLVALFALAACGGPAPEPTAPVAAPATSAAADTSSTNASTEVATQATPPGTPTAASAAETPDVATDSAANQVPEAASAAAPESAGSAAAEAAVVERDAIPAATPPTGPEPRLGTDYTIIDPPQQFNAIPGKVEIAEVFSYTCIHCARLNPLIPAWRKTLPAAVNFIQVPMAHGAFEPIARGFYAAQAMGVLEQTHEGMFRALAEQHKLGAGKLDDVARVYAELGVDAEALKATANSFTVNTQITRSQRTLARWAIAGTPSLVVAGKYLVVATADRGHEGMLQAARWLAENELARQAQ